MLLLTSVFHIGISFSLLFSILIIDICEGMLTVQRNNGQRMVITTVENLLEIQSTYGLKTAQRYGDLTITVYQLPMLEWVKEFKDRLSEIRPSSLTVDLQLSATFTDFQKSKVMDIFERYHSVVNTVVLFMENQGHISELMDAVCSTVQFKWTKIFHVTEWILVTVCSNINFEDMTRCTDFFTVINIMGENIEITRKARKIYPSYGQQIRCLYSCTKDELVDNFPDLINKGCSSLEGLTLPVAILENIEKYTDTVKLGHTTVYEGFSIAILDLLASSLKFNTTFVMPTDDGAYGAFDADGTPTGILGQLARRESAFSPMGLSKTEERARIIDYVETPILFEPVQIMYRLPSLGNRLDDTLLVIINPEFFLASLGVALVMASIAGVIHVLTKACTVKAPKFSKENLRMLGSFPNHICFHEQLFYAGQSGRILRASWGVFCFILSAAYSAYLVTSFTVNSEELKLDDLNQLLASPGYTFGVWSENSALVDRLEHSKSGIFEKTWTKIVAFNKTDRSVLSHDRKGHVLKVLSGQYAFISHLQRGDIPSFNISTDYSDVRSYIAHSLDDLANGYLTTPKNAFFKEEFNNFVHNLEKAGFLLKLSKKYNIYKPYDVTRSAVKEKKSVPVTRIMVLVYSSLCGILVSGLCLAVEFIIDRYWLKRRVE